MVSGGYGFGLYIYHPTVKLGMVSYCFTNIIVHKRGLDDPIEFLRISLLIRDEKGIIHDYTTWFFHGDGHMITR